jgi:hypothetical protein
LYQYDFPGAGDRDDKSRADLLNDVVSGLPPVGEQDLAALDVVPGAGPGDFTGEGFERGREIHSNLNRYSLENLTGL